MFPCTLSPIHPGTCAPSSHALVPLTSGAFTSTIFSMNQTFKNVALSLAVFLLVAFLCLTGYVIAAGIWAFFLNA